MGFTLQVGSEVIGAPDLFPEVPEYNDVLEKFLLLVKNGLMMN